MTLPVVWIPEADTDLRDALAWCVDIHADLGVRFALAVDAAVDVLAQSPLRFQMLHGQIRRAGVKRFPYGLFFKVESHRISCDRLDAWKAQSEALESPGAVSGY